MTLKHTIDSLKLVEFSQKYINSWHTYKNDIKTLKAVNRALLLGRIKINKFNQFKGI